MVWAQVVTLILPLCSTSSNINRYLSSSPIYDLSHPHMTNFNLPNNPFDLPCRFGSLDIQSLHEGQPSKGPQNKPSIEKGEKGTYEPEPLTSKMTRSERQMIKMTVLLKQVLEGQTILQYGQTILPLLQTSPLHRSSSLMSLSPLLLDVWQKGKKNRLSLVAHI